MSLSSDWSISIYCYDLRQLMDSFEKGFLRSNWIERCNRHDPHTCTLLSVCPVSNSNSSISAFFFLLFYFCPQSFSSVYLYFLCSVFGSCNLKFEFYLSFYPLPSSNFNVTITLKYLKKWKDKDNLICLHSQVKNLYLMLTISYDFPLGSMEKTTKSNDHN